MAVYQFYFKKSKIIKVKLIQETYSYFILLFARNDSLKTSIHFQQAHKIDARFTITTVVQNCDKKKRKT